MHVQAGVHVERDSLWYVNGSDFAMLLKHPQARHMHVASPNSKNWERDTP
jgi:hypothetical protein